jgi:dihydroorotate dehydrogenase
MSPDILRLSKTGRHNSAKDCARHIARTDKTDAKHISLSCPNVKQKCHFWVFDRFL